MFKNLEESEQIDTNTYKYHCYYYDLIFVQYRVESQLIVFLRLHLRRSKLHHKDGMAMLCIFVIFDIIFAHHVIVRHASSVQVIHNGIVGRCK